MKRLFVEILACMMGFLLTTAVWAADVPEVPPPTTPPPTTPAPPTPPTEPPPEPTIPTLTRLTTCTADAHAGIFCCKGSIAGLADEPTVVHLDAVYLCGQATTPSEVTGTTTLTPTAGVLASEVCTEPITNDQCPEPLAFGWLGQLTLEQPSGTVVLTGYGERLF